MFSKRLILLASVFAILTSSVSTGTAAAPQAGTGTAAKVGAKKKPVKKFNVRYSVVRRHPGWAYRLFPNKAMAHTFAVQMRRMNFRTYTQRIGYVYQVRFAMGYWHPYHYYTNAALAQQSIMNLQRQGFQARLVRKR